MKIQSFSKGKSESKNEDSFGFNEHSIVLSDGATDKSGEMYGGKTGGEIISKFIVEHALKSTLSGVELVSELTEKIIALYKNINPKALEDGLYRFNAAFVCVQIDDEKVLITQVGDCAFRINGSELYKKNELIDELNAEARSLYIEKTGDVAGSRDYILPILKNQHQYQNNAEAVLGYGAIDGTPVPEKFVNIFEFSRADVKTIELITDGYFAIPDEVSIEAYEKKYEQVEAEDPDKYKLYKSTKSKDDRTIIIATL